MEQSFHPPLAAAERAAVRRRASIRQWRQQSVPQSVAELHLPLAAAERAAVRVPPAIGSFTDWPAWPAFLMLITCESKNHPPLAKH